MNYEDFPILKNQDYELLKEQYQQLNPIRANLVNQICNNLTVCSNCCLNLLDKHNTKIKNALKETKTTIDKLLSNLSSSFNISTQNQTVKHLSLFSFINKLINTQNIFSTWAINEEKEYYKHTAIKNIIDLNLNLSMIIESLENSMVKLYKHM